jgi:hypothetical protein
MKGLNATPDRKKEKTLLNGKKGGRRDMSSPTKNEGPTREPDQ